MELGREAQERAHSGSAAAANSSLEKAGGRATNIPGGAMGPGGPNFRADSPTGTGGHASKRPLEADALSRAGTREELFDGHKAPKGKETSTAAQDAPRKKQRVSSKEQEKLEETAIKMQRWRTRKLAVRAGTFGMTSAIAKAIEFPELSSRLRDAGLIKTMKLMLHRVCVLTAAGVKLAPDAEVRPARALPRPAQRACCLFRL